MFYLIIGILLLLYYFFAAPQSIKGTLNSVTLVGAGRRDTGDAVVPVRQIRSSP